MILIIIQNKRMQNQHPARMKISLNKMTTRPRASNKQTAGRMLSLRRIRNYKMILEEVIEAMTLMAAWTPPTMYGVAWRSSI
jgi:hypothetical protein